MLAPPAGYHLRIRRSELSGIPWLRNQEAGKAFAGNRVVVCLPHPAVQGVPDAHRCGADTRSVDGFLHNTAGSTSTGRSHCSRGRHRQDSCSMGVRSTCYTRCSSCYSRCRCSCSHCNNHSRSTFYGHFLPDSMENTIGTARPSKTASKHCRCHFLHT